MSTAKLSAALLKRQDDVCSAAVVRLLSSLESFQSLSRSEGENIVRRDKEDEDKLHKGIEIGIAKGILPGKPDVPPVRQINVVGLSAQEVCEHIAGMLPGKEGNVIILQGLSGTGKGTTVAKLQHMLPRCVTWSNGNVFRSYTFLCNDILSRKNLEITPETLTPDLLEEVVRRVTFERLASGKYDILLDGKAEVSVIQNTLLKTPLISQKVPTVAEQTQGEVIRFGADAVAKLSSEGYNVILEGRAQTLQYIPTKERFELVIPDVAVLGQRRAAQRVMAKALELLSHKIDSASDDVVASTLAEAVSKL